MTLPIPTEASEQMAFVQWLRLKGLRFWRTPNETYTKSWHQKALNKALGVQAGIPDLFVVLPPPQGRIIAVEMKRTKGGVTSVAQKEWLTNLADAGIASTVARGADEAIAFVENELRRTT